MSSGGKGNSKSNTSNQATTTNTQETNTYTDNRVYQTLSDSGAISAATDISGAAIALGNEAIASNSDVSIRGLDAAQDMYASSLSYAGNSVDSAYEFASGVFESALTAQQKLVDQSQAGNASLAQQVSQSATQSVNEGVQKVALYALAAVAAILVLPAFARGFK